ncbi:MAG: ATP-binding protein [Candidatus Diapherotrites archaeon]|nr:ATP-binding protein [Candidatus Diapherotrites archaeon]
MPKFSANVNDELQTLSDPSNTSVFIGRNKTLHAKYGRDGALLIGRLSEDDGYGKLVYLDAMTPHVVFISGARGSGKSYDLGVMAEELTTKNPNVAVVIIDPIGIYWSMKYPNQEERELDELIAMGIEPRGIKAVNVFVPYGTKNTLPKDTYDKTYALRPSDLTVDDWCLTFGLDRFSPTGLLLEKIMEKTANGYKTSDGKKINPKAGAYSLEDIIECLNNDAEITSAGRGFKTDSRRALASRFEAAKSWGVFSEGGTALSELCREGEVSVIDVSFLDENVTSLVIGLLSRKILNARKLATRQTAMKRMAVSMDAILETGIPPTWLFIDEAHTLIPSGSAKTAATDPLIEYVKQGRRPGCSLVFATQQPAAIDSRVLSQLDVLLCHKLVFDDDLKAVFKRMPNEIPKEYSHRFIKTLPIGTCLVGDRSDETNRAFTMKVRPRFSQHEGRETRSVEFEEGLKPQDVEKTLVKMVVKQVTDNRRVHMKKVDQLIEVVKKRYGVEVKKQAIIDDVREQGIALDGDHLVLQSVLDAEQQPEEEAAEQQAAEEKPAEQQENLLAFKNDVEEKNAERMVRANKKNKFLGLVGSEEFIKELVLEYWPVYRVEFDYYEKKGFRRSVLFVDGMTGEIRFQEGKTLASTQGIGDLCTMTPNQRKIAIVLKRAKEASAKGLAGYASISENTARSNAEELAEKGILEKNREDKAIVYNLKRKLEIPERVTTPQFSGLESSFVMEHTTGVTVTPRVHEESVRDVPSIFGETKIQNVSFVYRPVWHARLFSTDGNRDLFIDGMAGKLLK